MLLSPAGFGALCRASVPGSSPTASDSVILLLTVQLFSLLPHCQWSDSGGQKEKTPVYCTPTEVKAQAQAWGGGHLASFSIQSGKFVLQKLWTQLTCPTFNFLQLCVSSLSACRKYIWSRTEELNSPGNSCSGCWMPVGFVMSTLRICLQAGSTSHRRLRL